MVSKTDLLLSMCKATRKCENDECCQVIGLPKKCAICKIADEEKSEYVQDALAKSTVVAKNSLAKLNQWFEAFQNSTVYT